MACKRLTTGTAGQSARRSQLMEMFTVEKNQEP
ncbi:hypothetical protein SAMN05216210_0755 [Halopseudomonas salegens]|uniref:Uncharacterized protein n=1 Tax=Halopseudomonas salegens TaxID=1434072 RepID=A0A1H2EIQ0_9GAMM|nr:hypothetical protein SAMN05216210_0755 [Halopseudomonas salegens]